MFVGPLHWFARRNTLLYPILLISSCDNFVGEAPIVTPLVHTHCFIEDHVTTQTAAFSIQIIFHYLCFTSSTLS